MNDPASADQAMGGPASPASVESLKARYVSAWQKALQGGAQPSLELFLSEIPANDRARLRGELEQLARSYQERLSQLVTPLGQQATQALTFPGPSHPEEPTLADSRSSAGGPAPTIGLDSSRAAVDDDLGFSVSAPSGGGPAETLPLSVIQSRALAATVEGTSQAISNRAAVPAKAERPTVPGYDILEELGRGGMGVVYKARQEGLNRLVALKMVLAGAHASPEQLERFQVEAEAVASLRHPQIVQIYEVGERAGLPFFSLEFVEGGSLAQMAGGKPLPPREAAEIVAKLADGMHYAHQHNIMHRDLKPANVLMTAANEPKITDFGLAKRLEGDSNQTRTGTLLGTPSYMAPEQARGEREAVGPAADQYALGAILYELLTGRPPFQGTTALETLEQARTQEPVPPTRLQPKIPRDLETICLKSLNKEIHKRYADVGALMEDLTRFLDQMPIKARPVSTPERAWRWCRRNPRVAALSGALAVIGCVLAVTVYAASAREARERQTIDEAGQLAQERLRLAADAMAAGDYRHAAVLMAVSDPIVARAPALASLRESKRRLTSQVAHFREFQERLDDLRFKALLAGSLDSEVLERECREAVQFYDDFRAGKGSAADGLPRLEPAQELLFKEDSFDLLLAAAAIEAQIAGKLSNTNAEKAAARSGISYLARAEGLLPISTRALYAVRANLWTHAGEAKAAQEDEERAKQIVANSAVDHFWHGFSELQRAVQAQKRGQAEPAQNHFRQSIAEFSDTLRSRPEHFWAHLLWAECHYDLAHWADAVVGYTACIRIRPERPWPYRNRAESLLKENQPEQAIQDFSTALGIDKRYAEAAFGRGLAYLARADENKAIEDFDRATALNPKYADAYYQKGEVCRRTNRLADAVSAYDRVIDLNPKNANAFFARGSVQFQLNHLKEARDDFSVVARLVPTAADAYRNRGIVNIRLKDFDAALADNERYAQLKPRNYEAYYRIAILHQGRREFDQALQALQTALEFKADYTQAYLARAQVFHIQGEFSKALEDLNHVLTKLEPDKWGILNDRGDLYRAMGRWAEAAADYERSIRKEPKQVDAYVGLALVYQSQNRLREAATLYDQMVEADRNSMRPYLRRAEFRRDQRDWSGALEDCERAAKLGAGSLLPALLEASVHAAQGQADRAVKQAEPLVAKIPASNGQALLTAASVWSLASQTAASKGESDQAKVLRDRAAELFLKAATLGYHDLSYQEYNRLPDLSSLAPIRDDPRVQELMPKVATPTGGG
jgi:serine/threonine protein kinase/tetratricopeptide (TPR) repeat protein